ncbi:hypothetical protein [Okeania sp. SIO1I7]|uniref:DUF6312 domain-containing protein n=1 Tax=Okeania sp. SIO1I7 TaxID=2607772 RepID=UPI0013F8AD24|nr:hypothetical protein [Okeania sp. SIO1I7]NET25418.1 hypothetical protein [Okeania sp. SIO1I7]
MAKEEIKSVTVLQSDEDFGGNPSTIYGKSAKKRKNKKKKQSNALKPYEKAVFKMAKMYDKATKEYRERHERSNRKKKNGWIKDFAKNYSKAMSKMGGYGYMGIKLFE